MEVVSAFLAAEVDDSPWVCGFVIAMVVVWVGALLEYFLWPKVWCVQYL